MTSSRSAAQITSSTTVVPTCNAWINMQYDTFNAPTVNDGYGILGTHRVSAGLYGISFSNPEQFGGGAYVAICTPEFCVDAGYGPHILDSTGLNLPTATGKSAGIRVANFNYAGFHPGGGTATIGDSATNSVRSNVAVFAFATESDRGIPEVGNWIQDSTLSAFLPSGVPSPIGISNSYKVVQSIPNSSSSTFISLPVSVTPAWFAGKPWTFSIFIKGEVGGEQICIANATGIKKLITLTNTWKRHSVTSNASSLFASLFSVQIGLQGSATSGLLGVSTSASATYYIAAAQLEPGSLMTEFVSTPPGAQATTYTGTKGNQDARKRLVPGAGGFGTVGNTYSSSLFNKADKRKAVAYGTIVIPPNKGNSSTVSAYIENGFNVKGVSAGANSLFDVSFVTPMTSNTYCTILTGEYESNTETNLTGATPEFSLLLIRAGLNNKYKTTSGFRVESLKQNPADNSWTQQGVIYQSGLTERIHFMVFGEMLQGQSFYLSNPTINSLSSPSTSADYEVWSANWIDIDYGAANTGVVGKSFTLWDAQPLANSQSAVAAGILSAAPLVIPYEGNALENSLQPVLGGSVVSDPLKWRIIDRLKNVPPSRRCLYPRFLPNVIPVQNKDGKYERSYHATHQYWANTTDGVNNGLGWTGYGSTAAATTAVFGRTMSPDARTIAHEYVTKDKFGAALSFPGVTLYTGITLQSALAVDNTGITAWGGVAGFTLQFNDTLHFTLYGLTLQSALAKNDTGITAWGGVGGFTLEFNEPLNFSPTQRLYVGAAGATANAGEFKRIPLVSASTFAKSIGTTFTVGHKLYVGAAGATANAGQFKRIPLVSASTFTRSIGAGFTVESAFVIPGATLLSGRKMPSLFCDEQAAYLKSVMVNLVNGISAGVIGDRSATVPTPINYIIDDAENADYHTLYYYGVGDGVPRNRWTRATGHTGYGGTFGNNGTSFQTANPNGFTLSFLYDDLGVSAGYTGPINAVDPDLLRALANDPRMTTYKFHPSGITTDASHTFNSRFMEIYNGLISTFGRYKGLGSTVGSVSEAIEVAYVAGACYGGGGIYKDSRLSASSTNYLPTSYLGGDLGKLNPENISQIYVQMAWDATMRELTEGGHYKNLVYITLRDMGLSAGNYGRQHGNLADILFTAGGNSDPSYSTPPGPKDLICPNFYAYVGSKADSAGANPGKLAAYYPNPTNFLQKYMFNGNSYDGNRTGYDYTPVNDTVRFYHKTGLEGISKYDYGVTLSLGEGRSAAASFSATDTGITAWKGFRYSPTDILWVGGRGITIASYVTAGNLGVGGKVYIRLHGPIGVAGVEGAAIEVEEARNNMGFLGFMIEMRTIRSAQRASPDLWKRFVPWITTPYWTDGGFADDRRYWWELNYHLILAGAGPLAVWCDSTFAALSPDPRGKLDGDAKLVHTALNNWRIISGNSKCGPPRITDYPQLNDQVIVSGAPLLSGANAGLYAWRLTVRPGLIGERIVLAQSARSDIPLTITIDDIATDYHGVAPNGVRGAWLLTKSAVPPVYTIV